MIDDFMGEWEILVPNRVEDGEGGFTNSGWKPDVTIKAACVRDSSMTARIAEQEGVTSVWRVITKAGCSLPFHTVLRCVKDDRIAAGTILRTTSRPGENKAPGTSAINAQYVTAESWVLTNE